MSIAFRNRRMRNFWHSYSQVALIYVFLITFAALAGLLDQSFLTLGNLTNLLTVASPFLLVAFAQTVVILGGGIDLSVGALVSLANVVAVLLMHATAPYGWVVGVLVALLTGIAFGTLNGFIVTVGRLEPVIVTLATSAVFGGLALYLMPTPGGAAHVGFARALADDLAGIPVPLILLLAVGIPLGLLLKSTPLGQWLTAVGGNESAAYSTGIPTKRVKLVSYALSGLLCAMAGIFLSAQMYSADPTVGRPYTMNSITAVVVGGTAMSGGKGGIVGSIAGVFIIVIINNILNLVNVSSFYQYILQGGILILALAISSLRAGSRR